MGIAAQSNNRQFIYRTVAVPLTGYGNDEKAILNETPPESPKVRFASGADNVDHYGRHRETSPTSRLVISILLAALLLLLLVLTAMLIAQHRASSVCQSMGCVQEAATIIKSINMDVSPCDDFFEFTCGGWIRDAEIPEHKSSRSRFDHVTERLQAELRGLLHFLSLSFSCFFSSCLFILSLPPAVMHYFQFIFVFSLFLLSFQSLFNLSPENQRCLRRKLRKTIPIML